jgi:hypothetical protein
VTRRLALVLVVLVTAATLGAAVLIARGGSESDADVRDVIANCRDEVESNAFNFGDACGPIGQRRVDVRERPGPPE